MKMDGWTVRTVFSRSGQGKRLPSRLGRLATLGATPHTKELSEPFNRPAKLPAKLPQQESEETWLTT
jgi:hypothetical protein